MKNIQQTILIFLAVFAMFYLIGVFIEINFGASKFTETARILIAIFGLLMSFFISISYFLYKNK